jgi:microcystin-dependent protein
MGFLDRLMKSKIMVFGGMAGAIISIGTLAGYVFTGAIHSVQAVQSVVTKDDLKPYAKRSDIPNITLYAKKSDLTETKEKMVDFESQLSNIKKNGIEKGTIVMWSGGINQIPDGWALCNGKKGTPNLENRFILAASDKYPIRAHSKDTDIGRTEEHVLTVAELPKHTHKIGKGKIDTSGSGRDGNGRYAHMRNDNWNRGIPYNTDGGTGGSKGHYHKITPKNYMPPYYALAFIIKT